MMARLLEAVRPDARLVLVGDPEQLASVEAGAVLGDLAGAAGRPQPELEAALRAGGAVVPESSDDEEPVVHGVVRLDHNWRFRGAIAEFASAVRDGDADTALALLRSAPAELSFVEEDPATVTPERLAGLRDDVVRTGLDLIGAAADGDTGAAIRRLDEHRLLCGHRRGPYGVTRWTAEVERWLAAARPGYDAGAPWYPGRPLLVTVNDYDLNLFNGDTGVVVHTEDGPRAVFSRDGVPTAFVPARLGSVSTVHAMTVHRSQGSQFGRVSVVLPPAESPLMTRELLYTAVTRAERSVRVIGTEDAVRAAIARPAGRASGLRQRLGGGDRP
jgi:exodeoxyribonuclease V alpha subunit